LINENGFKHRPISALYLQHEPIQASHDQAALGLQGCDEKWCGHEGGKHRLETELEIRCRVQDTTFQNSEELEKDPLSAPSTEALGYSSDDEPQLSDVAGFRVPLLLGMHPDAPKQYNEMFKQPFLFLLVLVASRIVAAMTICAYVYGWISTGTSWIKALPCIVHATLILLEIIAEHLVGPKSWHNGYGIACHFLHTAGFFYASFYVLVLQVKDKPFQSRLIHLLLCTIMAFCGGIFVRLNILCSIRKSGLIVPRMSVPRMVLWKGFMYTLRLGDCFTDIEVSAMLIQLV
jgi:hypothetical protein